MADRPDITAEDIHGAWVIMPTPATPDASDWRTTESVDLDESARIAEALIASGVNGILSLGTFGECGSLTRSEKRDFISTVVDTIAGRVPFFCGTTALHTREVVDQTREARDIGVTGTMLGVPMWCRLETAGAVKFYQDVAEACPDTAIAIYANPEAFKFEFSRPFWAEVGKLPQVVAAKYLNLAMLDIDLRLAPSIRYLPHEADYYAAARMAPERMTAFWSSGALCGPAAPLALRDLVMDAKATGDWSKAWQLAGEMKKADSTLFPKGEFAEFSKYNIALEKARQNEAGWVKSGPVRPPYDVVPDVYLEGARQSGRAWSELHRRYAAIAQDAAA